MKAVKIGRDHGGVPGWMQGRLGRSFMNKDLVHLMREYPNELDALCGIVVADGYDRNCVTEEFNFSICGECARIAKLERAGEV